MILAVEHVNLAAAVDRERPGAVELARTLPWTTPAAERLAFECKLLHAMVAVLRHVEIAIPVKNVCLRIDDVAKEHWVSELIEFLDRTEVIVPGDVLVIGEQIAAGVETYAGGNAQRRVQACKLGNISARVIEDVDGITVEVRNIHAKRFTLASTAGVVDGGDFNRSGFRIPMMVVSPFTKKNFVSHTPADSTAILKLIETRFNLPNLNKRDAAQIDMSEFFDFQNVPWKTPPTVPTQPTNGPCTNTLP